MTAPGVEMEVALLWTDERRLTAVLADAGLGEAAERAVGPLASVVPVGVGDGPVRLGVEATLGEVVVIFVKRVALVKP